MSAPLRMSPLCRRSLSSLPALHPSALVISGPSGVGKGRIVKELLQQPNSPFTKVITCTTRYRRSNEVDGVNYNFLKKDDMLRMIENGEFLEWAEIHGNYYGTSLASFQDAASSGRLPILEIDIQGAQTVHSKEQERGFAAKYLFISPPSVGTLRDRLRARNTETEAQIETRIKTAYSEMRLAQEHREIYDAFVVNDDFDTTLADVRALLETWFPQFAP